MPRMLKSRSRRGSPPRLMRSPRESRPTRNGRRSITSSCTRSSVDKNATFLKSMSLVRVQPGVPKFLRQCPWYRGTQLLPQTSRRLGSRPVFSFGIAGRWIFQHARVVQWIRTFPSEGRGCRFESYRGYHAGLAQMARALARHARGHRFESCIPHHSSIASRFTPD